jgi:hypothetical protein
MNFHKESPTLTFTPILSSNQWVSRDRPLRCAILLRLGTRPSLPWLGHSRLLSRRSSSEQTQRGERPARVRGENCSRERANQGRFAQVPKQSRIAQRRDVAQGRSEEGRAGVSEEEDLRAGMPGLPWKNSAPVLVGEPLQAIEHALRLWPTNTRPTHRTVK